MKSIKESDLPGFAYPRALTARSHLRMGIRCEHRSTGQLECHAFWKRRSDQRTEIDGANRMAAVHTGWDARRTREYRQRSYPLYSDRLERGKIRKKRSTGRTCCPGKQRPPETRRTLNGRD